jgi:hypothetical protein
MSLFLVVKTSAIEMGDYEAAVVGFSIAVAATSHCATIAEPTNSRSGVGTGRESAGAKGAGH